MKKHMSKRIFPTAIALFFLIATASCAAATPAIIAPATVAAQTLEAMLTQVAVAAQDTATPETINTPTISGPTFTPTVIPTVQFVSPSPNPEQPTATGPTPTIDATSLLTRTITAKCNAAFFVGDIGIGDGSPVKQGTPFTKTWDVRNIGTCTWTPNYRLVFQYGAHLGGPDFIKFNETVPPNGHIFLSVNLVAVGDLGMHQGQWYLFDPDGNRFGVGPDGIDPLIVRIKIIS
jgi:hypothetical protein